MKYIAWLAFVALILISGNRNVYAGPCAVEAEEVKELPVGADRVLYGIEGHALAAEIAAHPRPEVTPVPIDERQLFQRAVFENYNNSTSKMGSTI